MQGKEGNTKNKREKKKKGTITNNVGKRTPDHASSSNTAWKPSRQATGSAMNLPVTVFILIQFMYNPRHSFRLRASTSLHGSRERKYRAPRPVNLVPFRAFLAVYPTITLSAVLTPTPTSRPPRRSICSCSVPYVRLTARTRTTRLVTFNIYPLSESVSLGSSTHNHPISKNESALSSGCTCLTSV